MQELSDDLLTWIKNLSLAEKAIEAFFRSFKHYREEEPEEFAQYFSGFRDEWLKVNVQSASYRTYLFDNMPDSFFLYIRANYRGEDVLQYVIKFTLAGEFADDYLYMISSKENNKGV